MVSPGADGGGVSLGPTGGGVSLGPAGGGMSLCPAGGGVSLGPAGGGVSLGPDGGGVSLGPAGGGCVVPWGYSPEGIKCHSLARLGCVGQSHVLMAFTGTHPLLFKSTGGYAYAPPPLYEICGGSSYCELGCI